MFHFNNRFEFDTSEAWGGRAAAPSFVSRERTAWSWGSDAVDRRGFSDAISDAPIPPTNRGPSFPGAASTDPAHAARPLGSDYDPLDLEFMSEEELRDVHVRRSARPHSASQRALPLERVVRLLLERGYDPLDLGFMSEEELRDLADGGGR